MVSLCVPCFHFYTKLFSFCLPPSILKYFPILLDPHPIEVSTVFQFPTFHLSRAPLPMIPILTSIAYFFLVNIVLF
jgi:hypothetical protein